MTHTAYEKTQTARTKLVTLLEEMFQLDQPDLDFGFYRIMHAKADQVSKFLKEDLLDTIRDAFGAADAEKVTAAEQAVEAAIERARYDGFPDPEESRSVIDAKQKLAQARGEESREGEIYDHLTRFFERYYDKGDFMSRRYYGRESATKAAPYAVPYDGREVYLHWANKDQYYVKSAEYLSNFTFDLAKAKEREGLLHPQSLKVHCRLVDADEGEHNNVKASDATERFFLIHEDEPVKVIQGADGHPELVLQFEYRTDPKKSGKSARHQETRLMEAKDWIHDTLNAMPNLKDFSDALAHPCPTEKDKDRTLLDRYVAQYTARNTMDYFIHKDLGGFLRRELDFYIKNEVMNLDDLGQDIAEDNTAQVADYLRLIKVLRNIAHTLIDFLASLEEFQKKLWLKKKFVTETQYCITLDRIPEEFYPEIAANEAQREEWMDLFAIDELEGYSVPLTVGFLKANPFLVLDTAFFASDFKDALISKIHGFDGRLNGLLFHSENFQALGLMQEKYERSIPITYIDPPYNTVHSEIVYKNQYKHSSWLSLISNGIPVASNLWSDEFSFGVAIDDYEHTNLFAMLEQLLPDLDKNTVIVNHHPQGSGGRLSRTHEYMILCSNRSSNQYLGFPEDDSEEDRSFMRSGTADNNYRVGRNDPSKGRWKSFYALLINPETNEVVDAEPPVPIDEEYPTEETNIGFIRKYPINSKEEERVWRSSFITGKQRALNGELSISDRGAVYQKIEH